MLRTSNTILPRGPRPCTVGLLAVLLSRGQATCPGHRQGAKGQDHGWWRTSLVGLGILCGQMTANIVKGIQ